MLQFNKKSFKLQKSNEESTDLSSPEKHSTGEKRSSEAVTENSDVVSEVQPAAKKLKTCEDQAPSETTVESPVPTEDNTTNSSQPAANPAPQVAV